MFEETTIKKFTPSSWLNVNNWIMAIAVACISTILVFQICAIIEIKSPKYIAIYTDKIITYGIFLIPAIMSIIWAIYKTIEIKSVLYTITDQRIIRRTGIFSRSYTEIELIRVRDFEINEPFALRMIGLGNLNVYSAEHQTPYMVLGAQPNISELRDTLRQLVLRRQVAMGYREVGVGGSI